MHLMIIGVISIGIIITIIRFRSIILLGFEISLFFKQRTCEELTRQIDVIGLLKLQRRVKNMEQRLYKFEQRRIKEGYVCPTRKEILISSSWLWTPRDQERFTAISTQLAALDAKLNDLNQPVEKAVDRWISKS